MWSEVDGGRGANQVTSQGSGGQNKNLHIMAMYVLHKKS